MKIWIPAQLRSVVRSALEHDDHDFLRDVIYFACRAMSAGATRGEVKQALVGLAEAAKTRLAAGGKPAPGPVKVMVCGESKA